MRDVHLPVQSADLGDSPVASSIDDRHEAWQGDIPLREGDDRLWDWLDQLDGASRLALLAHCVSFGVNALYERPNPYSGMGISQNGLDQRLHEADRLARATGLDLVEAGWKPTVGNYLGRVTKARILEAVREGDYFTHFSCLLDVGTPANADRALDLHARLLEEDRDSDEFFWHGFDLSAVNEPGRSLLWIHSEDFGDVEAVVAFVLRCAEDRNLSGLWGFTYAHNCSRPRIDAFGGGAQVIDLGARKSIGWVDASHWLQAVLNGQDLGD